MDFFKHGMCIGLGIFWFDIANGKVLKFIQSVKSLLIFYK